MIADAPRSAASLQGTTFIKSSFLSDEDRQALCAIAVPARSFRANMDVVAEGVCADNIYVLTQGWACRYKTTRDGARQIVGLVLPGGLCNLDSFMLDEINFGVRSITAATVDVLPRDRVQTLAAKLPNVTRVFTWLAIVENAGLSQWALSLGRHSARKRVAHLLCELNVRLGGNHAHSASFELPITQESIADVLGLTAVHINRTMQQLKADGLIVARGRQIDLPDVRQLEQVGEFDASYLHVTVPVSARQHSASS